MSSEMGEEETFESFRAALREALKDNTTGDFGAEVAVEAFNACLDLAYRLCSSGPWFAVSHHEPAPGTVVLARWPDGAMRVVTWTPKRVQVTELGPHHRASIWLAHCEGLVALGFHEWPTHWAFVTQPGETPPPNLPAKAASEMIRDLP